MPLPRPKSSSLKKKQPQVFTKMVFDERLGCEEEPWSFGGDILNLSGWRVLQSKELIHDVIIVAELTTELEKCGCGSSDFQRWGFTNYLHVHDLPIRCKRTHIYYQQQRFRCSSCKKMAQQPTAGVSKNHQMTNRLVEHIKHESLKVNKPFLQLSDEIGVSQQLIRNIFTAHSEELEKQRVINTPEWLAIDEVFLKGRERCVISDPVAHRVLDILPGNSQLMLVKWLLQLPNRRSIKLVSIDMYYPYLNAVNRVLPQAAVVVDRYHAQNLIHVTIKAILQTCRETMSYSEKRTYMRDPILLLKSRYHLSTKGDSASGKSQKEILDQWLRDVPELRTAYDLKEDFSDILQLADRHKAELRLEEWLEKARDFDRKFCVGKRSKLDRKFSEPFGHVVTTVKRWQEQILNYISFKNTFSLKPTNAFAESANRLIKRLQAMGSGYNYEVIRAKVVHGGVLVKRPPQPPFIEVTSRKKRKTDAGGKEKCLSDDSLIENVNSSSNIVKLEKVREEQDKTKDLLPDPKKHSGWSKRFANTNKRASKLKDENALSNSKAINNSKSKRRRSIIKRHSNNEPKDNSTQLKMFE